MKIGLVSVRLTEANQKKKLESTNERASARTVQMETAKQTKKKIIAKIRIAFEVNDDENAVKVDRNCAVISSRTILLLHAATRQSSQRAGIESVRCVCVCLCVSAHGHMHACMCAKALIMELSVPLVDPKHIRPLWDLHTCALSSGALLFPPIRSCLE